MSNKQAGLTRVQLLALIVVIAVVGIVGFNILSSNGADPLPPTVEDTSPTPTGGVPAENSADNGSAENDPAAIDTEPHNE
jgi:hypothetical protein